MALEAASRDLSYLSESDEPFEVVQWKAPQSDPSLAQVCRLLGQGDCDAAGEMPLEEFFRDLVCDQDWHGPEEKAEVEKYRRLLAVIKERLSGTRVFKIGRIEVGIFIIGRAQDGNWVGLKTKAIET